MKEDAKLRYTDIIIACLQLRQSVGDDFFVAALDAKLRTFIGADEALRLQAVRALLELLSQLEHLKLGEPLALLACCEVLLKEKLSLLMEMKAAAPAQAVRVQAPLAVESAVPAVAAPQTARFPARAKKSNQVREEILKFIRQSSQTRTKEIVSQFGAVSHRTILRSLKELINQGLVVKRAEDGATRYIAS